MVATGTVGQRFTQLIAHLGISKNAFASSLDKTATVIQHIVDERNKPGFDLLCKVFEVYPNVSKDWLLQGTGNMLVAGASLPIDPVPTAPAARARVAEPRPEASIVNPQPVVKPAAVTPSVPVPVAEPAAAGAEAAPAAVKESPVAEIPVAAPAATSVAPTPADISWQTALYTQQMAHQLAMAELRNQHLQEQQRMMQQMMDLMKQQMNK